MAEPRDVCKYIKFCFLNVQINFYIFIVSIPTARLVSFEIKHQSHFEYPFSNILKIMGLIWVVLLYKLMRPITVKFPQ